MPVSFRQWRLQCGAVALGCLCLFETLHPSEGPKHGLDPAPRDGTVGVVRDLGVQTTST
jgi:hypothetical protein